MSSPLIPTSGNGKTTAFLTDSTLCIGCKACEVACKEWNGVAADGLNWSGFSYDNTGAVGHSTWRHVKFVEHAPEPGLGGNSADLASWSFSSDVCKHCEEAGCLEACPTGSIVRTEFGGVYVQPDICNGCAYCVVACPFGVVQKNKEDGRAFKCTFCYDRQKVGLQPACAKACPTESIKFGEINQLRLVAQERMRELHSRGMNDAQIYDPIDTSVKGTHAFFIVRGDPKQYNLPVKPEVPTIYVKEGWKQSAIGSAALVLGTLAAFTIAGRRKTHHRIDGKFAFKTNQGAPPLSRSDRVAKRGDGFDRADGDTVGAPPLSRSDRVGKRGDRMTMGAFSRTDTMSSSRRSR